MALDRKDARRLKRAAEAKFKRIDAQHAAKASAKDIRKNSDSWDKRRSNNVQGFHNPKRMQTADWS